MKRSFTIPSARQDATPTPPMKTQNSLRPASRDSNQPTVTPAHTPGPWHVENETCTDSLLRTWILTSKGEPVITFAFSPEHKDGEPEQYETAQANARLIASAPELLGELYNLTTWLEADANGYGAKELREASLSRLLDQARAAIARAKGQP